MPSMFKENSRNGEIIVEEYMRGPEVSVETLAVNGKVTIVQITDKITTGQPHFVELGHSQPSSLSYEIQQQIRDITVAANEAIGIKDGPSHTEIIVTEKGPKIVELGARLGGDCISSHLVPLIYRHRYGEMLYSDRNGRKTGYHTQME